MQEYEKVHNVEIVYFATVYMWSLVKCLYWCTFLYFNPQLSHGYSEVLILGWYSLWFFWSKTKSHSINSSSEGDWSWNRISQVYICSADCFSRIHSFCCSGTKFMSFIVFQVCDSSLWVIDMTKVWRSKFNIKHINSNLYSHFTNLGFFHN